jgi:hypothetical protein
MNQHNIPPFRGGQGRSDSEVERDGEGALVWAIAAMLCLCIYLVWRVLA